VTRYYWKGICNKDRNLAISELTSIVDKYAIILNFQRFSDISLSLMLELEECHLSNLQNDLKSLMTIDSDDAVSTESRTTCVVFFNVTFTKATGNLEIENQEVSD
jgi:hypothetical protein